jgi:hypothetical protein
MTRRYFHNELDGRPYIVEVAEKILQPFWALRPDHEYNYVINIPEPQRWFVLCCVQNQFLQMLHEDVSNDG